MGVAQDHGPSIARPRRASTAHCGILSDPAANCECYLVVVESVRFLSAHDADAQLHLESGQAADTLLCMVTVNGTFVMHAPMPGHDRTFHRAMLIFDGSSGNLLQLSEAASVP